MRLQVNCCVDAAHVFIYWDCFRENALQRCFVERSYLKPLSSKHDKICPTVLKRDDQYHDFDGFQIVGSNLDIVTFTSALNSERRLKTIRFQLGKHEFDVGNGCNLTTIVDDSKKHENEPYLSLVPKSKKNDTCAVKDCYDANQCCPYWKLTGLCEDHREYMSCNCRISCGDCYIPNNYRDPNACVDKLDKCEEYAKDGKCVRNPEYMLSYCRKSCRACLTVEQLAYVCDELKSNNTNILSK